MGEVYVVPGTKARFKMLAVGTGNSALTALIQLVGRQKGLQACNNFTPTISSVNANASYSTHLSVVT